MKLRPITPMRFADIEPGGADMPEPEYETVDPATLLVDESYQRNLSEASRRLIRRLKAFWDWRAFKPPSCVRVGDDIHVIDGQHTAIAAASHPKVGKIPVLIVAAEKKSTRAAAFVKLNRDRIAATPQQLHHALVEAGDEDALTIKQVCDRAGITILRSPEARGYYAIGETNAVTTIRNLIKRRYAIGARRVLQTLVSAKMAPVSTSAIRAVESLLFAPEYDKPRLDAADIATELRAQGGKVLSEGRMHAAKEGTQDWRGIAEVLYRRLKKAGHGHRSAA